LNLINILKERLYTSYKNDVQKKHFLQYLFLEITKKCNLNCLHCGSDCSKETYSAELTSDSWLKIIDYFKNTFSNNIVFVITGGEPLMHPDLIEIVSHINNQKMRWGMVSNGMLLNETMLEKLVNAGISSITISLDGTKDKHNWLRNNKNAFTKAIEAIQFVGKSKIPYQDVVTCVSPENLNELNLIAELLIESQIKEWRLFRIFPSGRANGDKMLELSFAQTQQMLHWIRDNKGIYLKKGLNINLSCEGWLPFDVDQKVRDFPFFCRSGINIASILSDGTITGCSNNSNGFYIGNILNDNFANLWENQFGVLREKKWLNEKYCSDCKNFKSCQGGSIHLWDLAKTKPNFCYAVDLNLPQKK